MLPGLETEPPIGTRVRKPAKRQMADEHLCEKVKREGGKPLGFALISRLKE